MQVHAVARVLDEVVFDRVANTVVEVQPGSAFSRFELHAAAYAVVPQHVAARPVEIDAEQNVIQLVAGNPILIRMQQNSGVFVNTAVQIFSSADNNEFFENNFIANLAPIRVIGRKTTTRWSRANRGNYWSEYDGYDLDADGIGDNPHRIRNLYERLEGDYPRLRIYFHSPAAQALAAAERVFPIMRTADEQDARPLMKPVALAIPEQRPRDSRNTLVLLGSSALAAIALLKRKGAMP